MGPDQTCRNPTKWALTRPVESWQDIKKNPVKWALTTAGSRAQGYILTYSMPPRKLYVLCGGWCLRQSLVPPHRGMAKWDKELCLITEKRKKKQKPQISSSLEWNTVVFCCCNMQTAAATCQTLGNNVGGSFVWLRRRPDRVPPPPLHLDVLASWIRWPCWETHGLVLPAWHEVRATWCHNSL